MKQFYLPTKVITGLGCFSQLAEVVRACGQKALFVSGRKALRRSGVLQRGMESLREAGVHTILYDGVHSEPTLEMVQEALDLARQEQVEVVVGMGGGSAMDVGKATAALCPQTGTVQEYHRGRSIYDKRGLPFVSLPTTAGTGTEVTNNAVLTDPPPAAAPMPCARPSSRLWAMVHNHPATRSPARPSNGSGAAWCRHMKEAQTSMPAQTCCMAACSQAWP